MVAVVTAFSRALETESLSIAPALRPAITLSRCPQVQMPPVPGAKL